NFISIENFSNHLSDCTENYQTEMPLPISQTTCGFPKNILKDLELIENFVFFENDKLFLDKIGFCKNKNCFEHKGWQFLFVKEFDFCLAKLTRKMRKIKNYLKLKIRVKRDLKIINLDSMISKNSKIAKFDKIGEKKKSILIKIENSLKSSQLFNHLLNQLNLIKTNEKSKKEQNNKKRIFNSENLTKFPKLTKISNFLPRYEPNAFLRNSVCLPPPVFREKVFLIFSEK
ncbi:hypothetical protein MHBO_003741, partial [Bonamia ostreae]